MLAHSTMNKHYSLGELTRMEDGREEQSETIKEARTFPTFRPSLSNRMPNKQLYRLLHGCPVAALLQGSHQFGVGRAHHTGAEQPQTLPVPTHGWPLQTHLQHTTHNRCCQSISKQYLLFCLCSVWTTETVCKVLRATIEDKDPCLNSKGSEDEGATHYPCLQVWVNLTASGQEVMLYQTEDTLERNPKVLEHVPLSPPAAIQHLPQLQFNFEHICGIGCH